MEENLKNSQKIFDAYCEQQNKFETIKDKAKLCADKHQSIEKTIAEMITIFDAVFKNFNPDRKPLGIFLLGEGYSDRSKHKKWIEGIKNVPENNRWYYSELCLHSLGFTLLPTYGTKSYNLIDGRNTLYNLKALKDKIPMVKLKEVLKPEKLELLNKILDNIETLDYSSKFLKPCDIKWRNAKNEYASSYGGRSKFNFKEDKATYIQLEAQGQVINLRLLTKKEVTYQDENINLMCLDFHQQLIIEQMTEELLSWLDEYNNILELKEQEVINHFKEIKSRLIKELIVVNLRAQKMEDK